MVLMGGLISTRRGLLIPMNVREYCTETILPFLTLWIDFSELRKERLVEGQELGSHLKQDEPESVYAAPPAVFSHYDDSHMWWVNTHISPVPDDIV